MFNSGSPKKRKNDDVPELPTCSKRLRQNTSSTAKTTDGAVRAERVREIINQEFSHEMKLKEMQLDQIDDRLDEANNFLNRLRYAIVAEYYKKQEQPQLMVEATKSMQSIATAPPNNSAVQIAMHPSLKKIIGKRPTNLEDIMKICPKRAAAQNAKYGICTKSAAKRKEERLREKIIREQGIVVDHSKIKRESSCAKVESNTVTSLNRLEASNPHTLNPCRTKNKTKYLFVVGNTSKYISNADTQVLDNVSLTHKWLVYVQTKDTDVPIAKYIKKVRFFLHPSYRPNDIIDVHAPPFQVARRGWGEFPMRIQLFFHDKFQQKPVQLIHRVVLDTSKSGRHTLGAETVMEVWLRDESLSYSRRDERQKPNTQFKDAANAISSTASLKEENVSSTTTTASNKSRTISLTGIKEPFDDNFMDFLNKIEETRTSICADIEKIQPTVVVNESLEPQLANVHRSPIVKNESFSPLKRTPTQLSPYRTRSASANAQNKTLLNKSNSPLVPKTIKDANAKLQVAINQAESVKSNSEESKVVKQDKPVDFIGMTNATVVVPSSNSPRILKNTKSCMPPAPAAKAFSNVSGTVILPVIKPQKTTPQQSQNLLANSTFSYLPANSVLQKKIVQVIDAQGKIKTVQMLVATPKPSLPANAASQASLTNQISKAANAINAKPLVTNLVTSKPFIIKSAANLPTSSFVTTVTANIATTTTTATSKQGICVTKQQTTVNNVNNIKSTVGNSSPKNVVFQKEGKLYIIDPLQMKLKQQQKNQVSLLKPQIKQQQQQQQTQSNIITTIATDHDYVHLLQKPQTNISRTKHTEASTTRTTTAAATVSLLRSSQMQLGMRNARLNIVKTQDLQKLRKIQFEKRFFRIKFSSMRSAIEYLLRRLPLNVFDKDSPAATFPFACTTPQEFRNLPACKQRSCEWLRAKFIARLLRNLQSLQQLDTNKEDTFWSTREIATFARNFAYTPHIKSLGAAVAAARVFDASNVTTTALPGSREHISELIKTEMQSEQLQGEYDSLSPVTGMQRWLEQMQQQLQQNQQSFPDEEIIVIDSDAETKTEDNKIKTNTKDAVTKRVFGSPLKFDGGDSKVSYLPPLARLETASQFVGETCKDYSIRLQPEEILPGIVHPVAQTLMAHVLKVFVDRLLRQTIANQAQQSQETQRCATDISSSTANTVDRCITAQDLRKTILDTNELDFLTNRHLGVSSNQIKHE